jgi:hypothetical protein
MTSFRSVQGSLRCAAGKGRSSPGLKQRKRPRKAAFLLSEGKRFVGGEEEDRTPDLRIANAALSQLSYPPNAREV